MDDGLVDITNQLRDQLLEIEYKAGQLHDLIIQLDYVANNNPKFGCNHAQPYINEMLTIIKWMTNDNS